MNLANIVSILIITVLLALAVRHLFKHGCCSGCGSGCGARHGCSGCGLCRHAEAMKDKPAK